MGLDPIRFTDWYVGSPFLHVSHWSLRRTGVCRIVETSLIFICICVHCYYCAVLVSFIILYDIIHYSCAMCDIFELGKLLIIIHDSSTRTTPLSSGARLAQVFRLFWGTGGGGSSHLVSEPGSKDRTIGRL